MPEGFYDASELAKGNIIPKFGVPDGNNTITHIWVPNTITEIGTWVFRNYTALVEVVFEDGPLPLSVGLMAFEGCRALAHVSMPGRVASVGRACFRNCTSLVDFEIGNGTAYFQMPLNVFDGCGDKERLCAILEAECNRRHAAAPSQVARPGKKTRLGNVGGETRTEVGNYLLFPYVKSKVNEPEKIPECVPNGTLFVCVDRTWGASLCDERTNQRIALEDCARGYWCDVHLSKVRLAECRWLMAIAKGRIEGVWKIDTDVGWKSPEETPKPTWPSDVGPWKVPRSGCLFMTDDDEVRAMRASCVGRLVSIAFAEHQTVRGAFKREG